MEEKKYILYLNIRNKPVGRYNTENEVWEAIGELPFGAGYVVRNQDGDVVPEFIPF